jgi:hypothetical protein
MEKSTSCYLERQKQKVTGARSRSSVASLTWMVNTEKCWLGKVNPYRWSADHSRESPFVE